MANDSITSTSVWALVVGVALATLIVGGFIGHYALPATETVTQEVVKEVPADFIVVGDETYTAEDIQELLSEDEEPVEKTELQENLDVRTAAVNYFEAEWKEEFKFEDKNGDFGPANTTYEYKDLVEDEGVDVLLEDFPIVEHQFDLLNEVTAKEVDISDSEWETTFDVEIEVDGTDYTYTAKTTYEDAEADDLELTQK